MKYIYQISQIKIHILKSETYEHSTHSTYQLLAKDDCCS